MHNTSAANEITISPLKSYTRKNYNVNGVQVGVEILTSKIRHENGDKFKEAKPQRAASFHITEFTTGCVAVPTPTAPAQNLIKNNYE
jgi:hypothetical protein